MMKASLIKSVIFILLVAIAVACGDSNEGDETSDPFDPNAYFDDASPDDGGAPVKECVTDLQCTGGQLCVAGKCFTPSDKKPEDSDKIKACVINFDCGSGEKCNAGICQKTSSSDSGSSSGGGGKSKKKTKDDGDDGDDDGDGASISINGDNADDFNIDDNDNAVDNQSGATGDNVSDPNACVPACSEGHYCVEGSCWEYVGKPLSSIEENIDDAAGDGLNEDLAGYLESNETKYLPALGDDENVKDVLKFSAECPYGMYPSGFRLYTRDPKPGHHRGAIDGFKLLCRHPGDLGYQVDDAIHSKVVEPNEVDHVIDANCPTDPKKGPGVLVGIRVRRQYWNFITWQNLCGYVDLKKWLVVIDKNSSDYYGTCIGEGSQGPKADCIKDTFTGPGVAPATKQTSLNLEGKNAMITKLNGWASYNNGIGQLKIGYKSLTN